MPILASRISTDIDAIAGFTETPGVHDRPTFSRSWRQARDYIAHQATLAGCAVRIDTAGNLHARPSSIPWTQPVWLSGSHIDSVPTGGKFDGVVGIVAPLECLRHAHETNQALPLELIIFAEEEGTTFGFGMMGSRLWAGFATPDSLSRFRNKQGQTYFEAGAPHGVGVPVEAFSSTAYLGLIEIHVEQGPAMWETATPLAVVTAIAGRKQYMVTVKGTPNHAGSTPMAYRADALTAAAKMIAALEQLAINLGGGTVATVGKIECEPNAINVIPGKVRFTIDLRSPDPALLNEGHDQIIRMVESLKGEMITTEDQPPVRMDPAVCNGLRLASNHTIPDTASGALHDAAILAPLLPTAMLFVASKDGISHNPAEYSRIEDITAAAQLLFNTLTGAATSVAASSTPSKPTLTQLNTLGRPFFVSVCGPLFEHSPWIAQRTWPNHPFESLAALHDALCQHMNSATVDEKLALISAHPDLVGRLAREGKLTTESTSEQSAAGLNQLSEGEAAEFDRYNEQYRAKFGFPFVICARENKKTAILAAFPVRLNNTREQEITTALAEIGKIARLRLMDAVEEM